MDSGLVAHRKSLAYTGRDLSKQGASPTSSARPT
jgi:hypothetical protein